MSPMTSQIRLVQPSVSHPSDRAVPAVQSEWLHDPCGGASLVATHLPDVQVSDVEQVLPHAPQLFGSLVVSTQLPVHRVPVPHTQVLLWHVAPDGQALPHMPQLLLSLVVSTQLVPHIVPMQVGAGVLGAVVVVVVVIVVVVVVVASVARGLEPGVVVGHRVGVLRRHRAGCTADHTHQAQDEDAHWCGWPTAKHGGFQRAET
jgi:hypothetical protein